MKSEPTYHLLYDGECSLCVGFADWVRRRDRRGQIELVPFEDPRVRVIVPGMTTETLHRSYHLVSKNGDVLSGHRAMPLLFQLLPGLGWLGWLLRRLPGASWLSEQFYRRIAASHHRP